MDLQGNGVEKNCFFFIIITILFFSSSFFCLMTGTDSVACFEYADEIVRNLSVAKSIFKWYSLKFDYFFNILAFP